MNIIMRACGCTSADNIEATAVLTFAIGGSIAEIASVSYCRIWTFVYFAWCLVSTVFNHVFTKSLSITEFDRHKVCGIRVEDKLTAFLER